MKRTLLIILTILAGLMVRGQCNQELVDMAINQSGSDAIFVREFKVKLKSGSASKPSPVGHFSIVLKEGSNYRFNVASSKEYDSEAILQLFDRDKLIGSTYNFEASTNNKKFEFPCNKTATYQVAMSFREAKEGCAVGVVSLISTGREPLKVANDTVYEVLYEGISNPLDIQLKPKAGERIDLSIDNGKIEKANGVFEVFPNSANWATIKLTLFDSLNNTILTKSSTFKVKKLPLPSPLFARKNTNMITRDDIVTYPVMELTMPDGIDISKYQIVDYSFSTSKNTTEEIVCKGGTLGSNVLKRIESLEAGDKVYITKMRVRLPDGKTVVLPNATYFIE